MAYIPQSHVATVLSGPGPPLCRGFTITLGRIPLDGLSVPFLKTQNAVKRETSMSPAGFVLAVPSSKWTQTDVSDRAGTGIGRVLH